MCKDTEFVQEIEEFFLQMVESGAALSESDVRIIISWKETGAPVELIKKALLKEKARMESMGWVQLPVRLKAYRAAVEKEILAWRRSSESGWVKNEKTFVRKDHTSMPDNFWDRTLEQLQPLNSDCFRKVENFVKNWQDLDKTDFYKKLEDILMSCLDEHTRKMVMEEGKKAFERAVMAGVGRMAASNMADRIRRRALCEALGVEGCFD